VKRQTLRKRGFLLSCVFKLGKTSFESYARRDRAVGDGNVGVTWTFESHPHFIRDQAAVEYFELSIGLLKMCKKCV
jgi:hypothetical protein